MNILQTQMKKVLAVSGSVRENSSNRTLIRYISEAISSYADVSLYDKLDLLPHFNPEVASPPEAVQEWRNQIAGSDALLITTPEYVFSPPAILKNALEWLVSTTLLSDKPIVYLVAAAHGEKTYETLDIILSTLRQAPLPHGAGVLIKGGKTKISSGYVEEDMKGKLNSLAASLLEQMRVAEKNL
jgi:chromate reductase, NAD(P)H dehydrogenase (quinone)